MRSRNPERKMHSWTAALDEHFQASMKNLNFAIPAIIQSYDATTKRAIVQPALDTLFADGNSRPKPQIKDVPVLNPSGGGYAVTFNHKKGDAVMLLVSQRGIREFKLAYKKALPSRTTFFSMVDAVAIPGFGGRTITPATPLGAAIQSEDGTTAIILTPAGVEIRTAGGLTVTGAGDINITSPGTLNLGGDSVNITAREINMTKKT